MNKRRSALLVLIGILLAGCNLPGTGAPPANPTDTAIPTAAEAVDVATFTPIPPLATITVAPPPNVPSVPRASPSTQAVNCRSGPALGWDVLALVQYGQSVQIVGKTADASWVQVRNPVQAGGLCWMSAGVVSITGNLDTVPIVAAPVAPTGQPTTYAANTVTDVSISLSKTSISVPGCVGPVQPITIYASIWVNGAVTLRWHFQTEQKGNLKSHALILSKATGKDVSDSFVPILKKGTYWVKLVIEGEDLSGMDYEVTYKISC